MSEIYKLTEAKLLGINNVLIKYANAADSTTCFCGSNKLFQNCCKNEPNYWIPDVFVESLIKFVQSQNRQVNRIPFLLGRDNFEDYYLQSHDSCARPNCVSRKTVNSHVYGKRHIEKYLTGNLCKIHNPYKDSVDFFTETHTGTGITYRIFCESCEKLFSHIDDPNHDIALGNNYFLHLLRTQAYQYQYCRWDLALSHQVILGIKGVIEIERNKFTGKSDTEFNLDWFLSNNIRYQFQSQLRNKLWNLYEIEPNSAKTSFFHSRKIRCKDVFFSSGIVNPSHDLRGNVINFKNESGIFYYAVPDDVSHMSVVIGSFDSEYQSMIEQLSVLNDYAFKNYLNHLFTMCSLPLSIVLSDTFKLTKQMILKIQSKKQQIQKTQTQKPSDIESRKIFVKFLK